MEKQITGHRQNKGSITFTQDMMIIQKNGKQTFYSMWKLNIYSAEKVISKVSDKWEICGFRQRPPFFVHVGPEKVGGLRPGVYVELQAQ